jgi:hypothetical protein
MSVSAVLKGAGWLGAIVTLIFLLIQLVRNIIAFIGFLMWVLKAGVVLAFVALIAAIALVVWRDYMKNKRAAED